MKTKFDQIFKEAIDGTYSQFMIEALTNIKSSIIALNEIMKDFNIRYVIIGGAAVEEYGYARFTEDIDILVDIDDKDKLLKVPPGFIKQTTDRTMWLHSPKIKLEIIYSGDKFNEKGLTYAKPSEVSELHDNVPFLTLPWLIQYKLGAGAYGDKREYQDYADVAKLISNKSLNRDFAKLNKFREDLVVIYETIYDKYNKPSEVPNA